MAATLTGDRLTPKQKSRVTLSVRDPLVTTLLAGLSVAEDINELHAFGKRLVAERNEWDVSRRRGALFGNYRFSKADADRAFNRAFGGEGRP